MGIFLTPSIYEQAINQSITAAPERPPNHPVELSHFSEPSTKRVSERPTGSHPTGLGLGSQVDIHSICTGLSLLPWVVTVLRQGACCVSPLHCRVIAYASLLLLLPFAFPASHKSQVPSKRDISGQSRPCLSNLVRPPYLRHRRLDLDHRPRPADHGTRHGIVRHRTDQDSTTLLPEADGPQRQEDLGKLFFYDLGPARRR